jgi:competence protein ComEA
MLGARGTVVVFAILILAIVGGSVLLLMTQPAPVQITIIAPQPTGSPAPLSIYVTGAVRNSGTVITLPVGSLAQDAVEAAGGAAENADLTRVNLARRLFDGDQVHVPEISTEEAQIADSDLDPSGENLSDNGVTNTEGIINGIVYLNRASSDDLQQLPGIGPAIAERILAYRAENGRITSFEDLDEIEGIGQGLISDLQGLVAFD